MDSEYKIFGLKINKTKVIFLQKQQKSEVQFYLAFVLYINTFKRWPRPYVPPIIMSIKRLTTIFY